MYIYIHTYIYIYIIYVYIHRYLKKEIQSIAAILPKLFGNCAFPQNFHIRKLAEITVFYAVYYISCVKMLWRTAKKPICNIVCKLIKIHTFPARNATHGQRGF